MRTKAIRGSHSLGQVSSANLAFAIFSIYTWRKLDVGLVARLEVEAAGVSARSQSAEVDSRLVCEGSVGKVVGSSSVLLATHSRRVAVRTSRPLGVVVHAVQRSSREWSLVTAHQLLRCYLSDELLLARDEVHLRSLLSTTHEGAIACTVEGESLVCHVWTHVLTISLSRVESVGEGVEALRA